MKDLFPTKLAIGDAFCNRVKEKERLKTNIAKAKHTLLISPRRYGKSSLVHNVALESGLPHASIDLFLAHSDKTITRRLLAGIAEVLSKLLPKNKKILQKVQNLFSHFKITLGVAGFNIEAAYERHEIDPVEQILDALTSLSKLSQELGKKVIIFIDEFQDIAQAESAKTIQGAIRHVAQETSNIVFIFSGSNRHLLLELFDDKSMPLYMLCAKIHLDRIHSKDYKPHLQKLAIKQWGKELSDSAFNRIMRLTEMHPFYVNFLCDKLWENKTLPTADDADTAWANCYEDETRRLRAELEKLSKNQQELLKSLACEPTTEPTGKNFIQKTGLPYSSIRQALNVLYERDMIIKINKTDPAIPSLKEGQIRVLDPLIAYALRKYS